MQLQFEEFVHPWKQFYTKQLIQRRKDVTDLTSLQTEQLDQQEGMDGGNVV